MIKFFLMLLFFAGVFCFSGAAYSADETTAPRPSGGKEKNSLATPANYDTIQPNTHSSVNDEHTRLIDEHAQLKKDYLKLNNDYQMVTSDRDNLLIQTKKMIAAKNRTEEMLAMLDKIQREVARSAQEKEMALARSRTLEQRVNDLENVESRFETSRTRLLSEKEQLAMTVAGLKEQLSNGSLAQENSRLKKDNASLHERVTQLSSESRKSEELEGALVRARAASAEFERRYKETVRHTRAYEKKLASGAPAKLHELSRQNQSLIEETAVMHYNLGVFYTRQKEYSRAAVEFEKTLELKPDDAQAHFNLGYIYAEYLVNRKRAVDHFQDYLKYVKKEDKDVDWVRRYILTWQAWDGKEPMK